MKIFWLSASILLVLAFAAVARNSTPSAMAAPESASSASALFARHCATCHGKDGRARGLKARTTGARNLTDPQWQDRVSDERLFNSINNGKGHMPGFGKKILEAEVDSLVQYVRGLKRSF